MVYFKFILNWPKNICILIAGDNTLLYNLDFFISVYKANKPKLPKLKSFKMLKKKQKKKFLLYHQNQHTLLQTKTIKKKIMNTVNQLQLKIIHFDYYIFKINQYL